MKKTTGFAVLAAVFAVFSFAGAVPAHAAIVGYGGVPITGGFVSFTPGVGQGEFHPVNPYTGQYYPSPAASYYGYGSGYGSASPVQYYNNFNPVYQTPNYNYSYSYPMNYPSYNYMPYNNYMPQYQSMYY